MKYLNKARGFPGGTSSKELACQCGRCKRCGINPGVGKIPWRKAQLPTPVPLPGESMYKGDWWATVHKVVKSQTQLKQFSTAHTHDFM